MNMIEEEDYLARRQRLSIDIARQRGELGAAYRNLEKPIRYTEYGMRGFGFLRQNPWVIAAVPAVINLVSIGLGWRKKKKSAPVQAQPHAAAAPTAAGKLSRLGQVALSGVQQGLRVYQLYRRIRSYLP